MLIQANAPQITTRNPKPSLAPTNEESLSGHASDSVTLNSDQKERFNARPLLMLGGAALGTAAVTTLLGLSQGVGGFPGAVTGAVGGAVAGTMGTFQFFDKAFNYGSADEALGAAFAGALGGVAGLIGGAVLGGMGFGTSATMLSLGAAAGGTGGYYLASAVGHPKTGWKH